MAFQPDRVLATLVLTFSDIVRTRRMPLGTLPVHSSPLHQAPSRQIKKYCKTDAACRVIAANHIPEHSTISRFRKDNASLAANRTLKHLQKEINKMLTPRTNCSAKEEMSFLRTCKAAKAV